METKGPGIVGLLGLAFVVLKLTAVIDWSWWWVTLPFWGPFVLIGAFVLFALTMAVTVAALDSRTAKKFR